MESRFLTWLRRFVPPWLLASLAVLLLFVATGRQLNGLDLLREFLLALLYSLCIGAPLSLLVPLFWSYSKDWGIWPRWSTRAIVVAVVVAAGCMIAGLCPLFILGSHYNYGKGVMQSFELSMLLTAVIIAFFQTYETYKAQLQTTQAELHEKELERERAQQLATAARLSSLESRLHPHFLFNTINSISSLIHENPKRAETMLTQLAELLRFSLDSSQGGLVTLEREMKIVEDYLEIEKARFATRLRYSLDVPLSLFSVKVPPLAVQTLVENSVKYAVGPRVQGASIHVSASSQDGFVRILVTDDGPGFSAAAIPAGHGLNNLQDRLHTLFGENGHLQIESTAKGAAIAISIPATTAKAA